ncbi:MAG: Oxidoreductase [Candidatus Bipolaricaulis sibiricus]|uniref:Oxidoreductase n=1 Tax=Bipolaricaulis sibiricus TaxID=2501609 RepID=A0A410FU16_BIPS1|nr:MAG: Oxidoreductase [Candidatus Bipolaricaulis sibiricus]
MRIEAHPILSVQRGEPVRFTFEGRELLAYSGETIAAALFAAGIRTFGHHPKDGAPQGIFCANGQCAQCLVIADGVPVKACMTPVQPGMRIEPADGLPELPRVSAAPRMNDIERIPAPVLVIGGGPAGLSASIELGARRIRTLLVDDKSRLGGKLVLQTHRFFGSTDAVYAGTRGTDIATRLENEVRGHPSVEVWLNSVVLAVYSDGWVGVLREGEEYVLVRPEVLLVATGAREKSLLFRGNTLPGVYGAGAFQTLVNRDLVRAADRLFIVGGGNVGLIAGYHAIQAGIEVVGLVEAMPECGGYKVHRDKLARLGVPIHTSHTILSANGKQGVESVTIARVDDGFRPVPGTEKTFPCDTVLVAVGLDPVDEFYRKARAFGMKAFAAGDAEEIAEASAAIFSGKIVGRRIAQALGAADVEIPPEWERMAGILKSRPGARIERTAAPIRQGVVPVLHCHEEIPCNPCTSVCPQGLLEIDPQDIRRIPEFRADEGKPCLGCERCVVVCPGLAITLVDYRQDRDRPVVTLPHELGRNAIQVGTQVTLVGEEGEELGEAEVRSVRTIERNDRTVLVKVSVPASIAPHVAGIRVGSAWRAAPLPEAVERLDDDQILCRCERVTVGEIRALIRAGFRDMNEIKAVTRSGMGACGGKTCGSLLKRLFRDEGVPLDEVTDYVGRPLFVEVPLGRFAGVADTRDG